MENISFVHSGNTGAEGRGPRKSKDDQRLGGGKFHIVHAVLIPKHRIMVNLKYAVKQYN